MHRIMPFGASSASHLEKPAHTVPTSSQLQGFKPELQELSRSSKKPNPDIRKSDEGQALVEFTLILALFLIVIFGIIEFAFILYNKVSITDAAREGARTGAMYRANSNGTTWTEEQIETFARDTVVNYLQGRLFTFGTPNLTVVADWKGVPPSQGGTDGRIEVVVNYDYGYLVLPRLSGSGDGTLRLSSMAIMRTE